VLELVDDVDVDHEVLELDEVEMLEDVELVE